MLLLSWLLLLLLWLWLSVRRGWLTITVWRAGCIHWLAWRWLAGWPPLLLSVGGRLPAPMQRTFVRAVAVTVALRAALWMVADTVCLAWQLGRREAVVVGGGTSGRKIVRRCWLRPRWPRRACRACA